MINAVDDQLYYPTSDEMRTKFEKAISDKYDVELMGQAQCYLQSRFKQHTNYDISFDQTR